jgi:hypothetical protein
MTEVSSTRLYLGNLPRTGTLPSAALAGPPSARSPCFGPPLLFRLGIRDGRFLEPMESLTGLFVSSYQGRS